MQRFVPENGRSHGLAWKTVLGAVLLVCWIAGCGGGTKVSTSPPTSSGPQTYFAPLVAGVSDPSTGAQTYAIDDEALMFSQTVYQPSSQPGPQVINAGVLAVAQRGLRSLGITVSYIATGSTYIPVVPPNSPEPGSFAVELAGHAAGLAQMLGQPGAPLVAATQCPDLASAQTYQFVTIPAAQISPNGGQQAYAWNPVTETAYGSVDISSSGGSVKFQNIHQYTLPSVGGTGAPAQPASSATGTCGPTFFGNTISVPGQLVITDPGGNNQLIPPQATVGIGISAGLLVEDNGATTNIGTTPPPSALHYNNVLGAGTGAVGLPKPSSALDTGTVVGAQYLGFIYGAGVYPNSAGWSSHLASFGFSSTPSSCASVAAGTGTLIYGGDFTSDNPSTSPDGFGNCDFAIDLGAQDASNNGLYPHATVWVGAGYAANTTGSTYSFPAVAIAGQLNGKYAIFVIGDDSTQPWAIDLLQSN